MGDFTGHVPGSRGYRRLLAALFCAGIAMFAQLYSPQAVLPLISGDFAVAPATAALAVSAATLGIAAAVIPWSIVGDHVGRVPTMAIGIAAASVFGALAPFAPGIELLLALRLAEGVALGALPAMALAYLVDEVDPGHAAAAAGSYIAGTIVGGLSGRLVSGFVGDLLGWRWGLGATAALCLAAAVAFVRLVPPSRGFTPGRHRTEAGPTVLDRMRTTLRSPAQLALDAQGFLLMGAFVAVFNYLGFHLSGPPYSLPTWLVTLVFVSYLAGTVSSPWAGALASRHGRLPVLLVSVTAMVVGTVAMVVPSTPVVLVGLLVFTSGFFAAHAVASGWAPAAAPPTSRAQASSLYYLAYYSGSSLFGWSLGIVFASAGWSWFAGAVALMCTLSGVVALVALRRAPNGARQGVGARTAT